MKKRQLLALLPAFLFVTGCDVSTGSMPTITIVAVCVNGDQTNYSDRTDKLPTLSVGDELTVELALEGNGDLSRFAVQEGREPLQGEEEQGELFAFTIEFNYEEVSNTISKPEEGTLAFKDGVRKANLTIKIVVTDVANDAAILFYLSSKGHSEAAKTGIILNLLPSE
jgi:hypothetical protein